MWTCHLVYLAPEALKADEHGRYDRVTARFWPWVSIKVPKTFSVVPCSLGGVCVYVCVRGCVCVRVCVRERECVYV